VRRSLVAAPAGGVMMRVTPEDILTGGLGLVVVLFVIVGVLAWITWMRRLGFWHFLGMSQRLSAPPWRIRGPSITQ